MNFYKCPIMSGFRKSSHTHIYIYIYICIYVLRVVLNFCSVNIVQLLGCMVKVLFFSALLL